MDLITPYLTYAAALAVAAAIPGPGVAALVGQSLAGNARSALFFVAGIALGDVIYLTVAVIGLAAIAKTFAAAFAVIKVAGACYLLYLAWKFWTSKGGLGDVRATRGPSGFRAFFAAVAVTLGNPKTVVFYLALLPSVLDLETVTLSMWFVLSGLTVLILFAVLIPYLLLATQARAIITRPKALRRLNRFAGGIIGSAGAVMIGEAAYAAIRRA